MQNRIIPLKLFLDQLNIQLDTSTYSGRKVAQKAVYLGKLAGADLGYTFGWYSTGPFSPELMRDLIYLERDLWLGDETYQEYELHDQMVQILKTIKQSMIAPVNVDMSQAAWLELMASVAYRHENYKRAKDKVVDNL